MGAVRRGSSGFTIIELLVVIAVSAVLLGIAVPSFTDFVAQQRVKSNAEQLRQALIIARAEAVKSKRAVYIKPDTGGWSAGWFISRDHDNDGDLEHNTIANCSSNSGGDICLQVFNEMNAGTVVESSSQSVIAFNSQGRPTSTALSFRFCDPNSDKDIYSRTLSISISGTPTVAKGTTCDN